jgi:hypothetical protein
LTTSGYSATESPIDVHPGERFAAADFGHSDLVTMSRTTSSSRTTAPSGGEWHRSGLARP